MSTMEQAEDKVGTKIKDLFEVVKTMEKDGLIVDEKKFETLVEAIPGGVAVYKLYRDCARTLYFSPKICAITGHTVEEYEKEYGLNNTTSIICNSDRGIFYKKVKEDFDKTSFNMDARVVHKDGHLAWINVSARGYMAEDGGMFCVSVIQPISEYSTIYEKTLDEVQEMIVIADFETSEILYVNNKVKNNLFGGKDLEEGMTCDSLFDGAYELCKNNKTNGKLSDKKFNTVGEIDINNRSFEIKSKVDYLYNRKVVVACFCDVTEKRVLMSKFDDAIEMMTCGYVKCKKDEYWTVVEGNSHFFKMIGYTPEEFKSIHQNRLIELVAKNHIKDILIAVKNNTEESNFTKIEYSIEAKDGSIIYVVDQSSLVIEDGKEFLYSTFFDITERKISETIKEERYQEELEYKNSMLEKVLVYVTINVSNNIVTEWHSRSEKISKKILNIKGMSSQQALKEMEKVYDGKTVDFLKKEFDIAGLKEKYINGEKNYSFEHYFSSIDEIGSWVSAQFSLRENPKTKEIEAFVYFNNITSSKLMTMAIDKEVVNEYDYIACIDAMHNRSIMRDSVGNTIECDDYEAEVKRYANTLILPEDRAYTMEKLNIGTVLKEIESTGEYIVVGRELETPGVCYYKQYKYSYLDEKKKLILFAQKDITQQVEKEHSSLIRDMIRESGDDEVKKLAKNYLNNLKKVKKDLLKRIHYSNFSGLLTLKGFCIEVREVLEANPKKDYSILMIDINNFKIFNDLFGRSKGDELLNYIGECLKKITNERNGVCGYLGADDFIIFYEGCSEDKIIEVVNRLDEVIKRFYIDYKFIPSIGVYSITDKSISIESMCDRAELALDEAKREAKTYCVYDDTVRANLIKTQEIVNEFSSAIAEHQFKMYLQPQYDINKNQIVGAEALARWIHPKKGLISPVDFIPVLEQNGLISQLDKYILSEACRVMALLKEAMGGGNPPSIAVNLSRADIFSNDFIENVESILTSYNLDNNAIRFEITESLYVEQPEYMLEFVSKLREKGYSVEMDDFGSGYSSLNALKDMEIDLLKLDMNFLSDIQNGKSSKIVEAVVSMAKSLDIPVLSEGVETIEQVEFLKKIGCNLVQGYYFAKPIPIEEYINLLMGNKFSKIKE